MAGTGQFPGSEPAGLPADQTSADFTLPNDGAYLGDLQARTNNGNLVALAHTYVNQAADQPDTTPPRLVRGEMDGGTITLYFSERWTKTR